MALWFELQVSDRPEGNLLMIVFPCLFTSPESFFWMMQNTTSPHGWMESSAKTDFSFGNEEIWLWKTCKYLLFIHWMFIALVESRQPNCAPSLSVISENEGGKTWFGEFFQLSPLFLSSFSFCFFFSFSFQRSKATLRVSEWQPVP